MNQTRKFLCRLVSAVLILAALCVCAAPLSAFADTVPVTGVDAPSALSLTVGQTGRLNASVIPADATDTALIFSSSEPSVLEIATDGSYTAKKAGQATVTVKSHENEAVTASCRVTVTASAQLTGISLRESSILLRVRAQKTLEVLPSPAGAALPAVTYTSDNSSVATVTSNGTVQAVSVGTTTVTATAGGYSASCTVTVTADDAAELVLPSGIATVAVGSRHTLNYAVKPNGAKITWSVSDTSLATVADGVVTGVRPGFVTVTAKSGSLTAEAYIVVYDPASSQPAYIRFAKTSYNVTVGATVRPDYEIYPSGLSVAPTFESSDTKIFRVDSQGNVTGVAAGKATLTVKCGSVSAQTSITVAEAGSGLVLDRTQASLYVGNTFTIKAKSPADARLVSCESSNQEIALARTDGAGGVSVTGVSAGVVTVTVRDVNGRTATCTVTVVPKSTEVTGVKLDRTTLTMNVGDTAVLVATVLPQNAEDQSVSFSSEDTSIVRVTANGKLTAIAPGTTDVIAYANGYTAVCRVTVVAGGISDAEPWKGGSDTSWYREDAGEFTITTPDQLAGLAELVNAGNSFSEKTVTLGADILFGTGSEPFTRIGTKRCPFSGTFSGDGHTVAGIMIKGDAVGLFGYLQNATVHHLTVQGTGEGDNGSGLLAGYAISSTVSCIQAAGSVSGRNYVGGIIGYSEKSFLHSLTFSGTVSGIFGIGGIAGFADATVLCNASASGAVSGTYRCGGAVGCLIGSDLENAASASKVSGTNYVGGLVGFASSSNLSVCCAGGEITGSDKTGAVVGGIGSDIFADSVWYLGTGSDTYFQKASSATVLCDSLNRAVNQRGSGLLTKWSTEEELPIPAPAEDLAPVQGTLSGTSYTVALSANATGFAIMDYTRLFPALWNGETIHEIVLTGDVIVGSFGFSPLLFTLLNNCGQTNVYTVTANGELTVEHPREANPVALTVRIGEVSYALTSADISWLCATYSNVAGETDLASYFSLHSETKSAGYAGYAGHLTSWFLSGSTGDRGAWYIDCSADTTLKLGDHVTAVMLKPDGTFTTNTYFLGNYQTQGGSALSIRIEPQSAEGTLILFRGDTVPEELTRDMNANISSNPTVDGTDTTVIILTVVAAVILAGSIAVITVVMVRRHRRR